MPKIRYLVEALAGVSLLFGLLTLVLWVTPSDPHLSPDNPAGGAHDDPTGW